MNSYLKRKQGFTLLEFVVVVALAAMLVGVMAILLSKGRDAANFSTAQERLRIISTGLSEHNMFKNSLPVQDASSTTWPAALDSYVDAAFRSGGSFPHGYQCTGNSVTIRTPAYENDNFARGIMTRLVDQNICTSASTVTTGNEVDCVLKIFANSAHCR